MLQLLVFVLCLTTVRPENIGSSSGDSSEVSSLSRTTTNTLINKTLLSSSTDAINPSTNVISNSRITLEKSDSLSVTSKNEFISTSAISQSSLSSSTRTPPSETPTTQATIDTQTTQATTDTQATQATTDTQTTQATTDTQATQEITNTDTNQSMSNPTTQHTTKPTDTESEATTKDPLIPTAPPGESEESIASISIFFILVLLGVSVVMVHLFIKCKFHYLPESIGFVLLGFVIGAVMFILNLFGYDYQYQETFSPQFFFLVLLPPIIFESGYSLHKGNFFQNLGSIITFAVFGTAISAVIVGGGIYALGVMGVVYKLDLIQSFTFGSLISAVDPVATLAIFHALDVDPTLNMLVFGESVLNDAVSIVLTKTILNQLPSNNVTSDIGAGQILGNSAWQFCIMFFGSALLGVVFALLSAFFLKVVNLRRHQSLEFAMWVIFAFTPYFLAEGLHLSGIMAILFCGIVMSHYTHYNLSPVTQVTVQQALRTVAFMAETGVFLYLGLALFSINKSFDLALIIWSVVLILIGRAANIFPLTGLMNCCRSFKITLRMQFIMWYSGLRGAVAFALAENLREYFNPEVTGYIVTTTLMIVLFTIIILGGSTLPLLKFLKADKGAKLTLSKTEEQGSAVSGTVVDQSFTQIGYRRIRNCSQWFMFLDYRYMRPLFIRRFTRAEVKAAQFEMQQKTVEWYQGLREASLSDEEVQDTDTSTRSTLMSSSSPIN